jgi:regulator of protease activity HflC (stomatin/prohibitin superfamily)
MIALLAGIILFIYAGASAGHDDKAVRIILRIVGILIIALGVIGLRGLTSVSPGQAKIVQLWGRYQGTVRTQGLRWVNPLSRRLNVSTRIRNLETTLVKVNDADGNPIEIAAVVVWQVADTAQAFYEVEDFASFVETQAETAVRHIASVYPYDSCGTERLSLQVNSEKITEALTEEIGVRVSVAGIRVIESRLSRLAYAPEIAHAMLQRQQADAVVAARERIVTGAVGMVEMALQRLAEDDVVDLDDERKAAMVSNLLVVLCADRPTQPIVNAGSLYQ